MNSKKSAEDFLKETLVLLKKACILLDVSFKKIEGYSVKENYSAFEIEMIEVFTARFSRLVDLLLKKAYRSLDTFELLEGGSLIDVVHRAEKRGIVHSLVQVRTLRDVRNLIAHEYAGEDFKEIFSKTKSLAPELLELSTKFEKYCQNVLRNERNW
ncbi:MAG: hypothetical protein V4591_06665 [Bdellovibrionota bacterium]